MQLLTELKNLARKTPMGKRAIARKRIYSLVDFCRLSPEEIRQGEADPAKMQEESLGLSIVRATVQDKLKGKLHIVSSPEGTKVSFDFKNE